VVSKSRIGVIEMRVKEILWITRVAKKFDKTTGKFRINIRYKTRTEVTPRTVAVAEAFGLGVDQFQQHVIYDDVELKIGPADVVYITGESGSGKSVLLKRLERELAQETVNIKNVRVDPKKPLIDTIGKTLEEGLELLSRVGLNDAFLFVRRYNQLSDGQKYRYRIAKMIETGKQYWVMDEFAATLDRDTAKIVAYNVQKLARQLGKAVLAATTHTDLLEDLKPSVHVHKRFGKEIQVKYFPNEINKTCSLTEEMHIAEGTREDYKKLAAFHYRSSRLPAPFKTFALKHREETVGVIVYSFSPAICFGRKQALGRTPTMQELIHEFAWISRVVLHPKYRTIGLGARLVKETLPLVNRPYIETTAVMAKYNPFFERAGMQKIAETAPSRHVLDAVEKLRPLGFNSILLSSERANMRTLEKMSNEEVEEVKNILKTLCKRDRGHGRRLLKTRSVFPKTEETWKIIDEAGLEKLAKTLRVLSFLAQTKVYLIWKITAFRLS